MINCRPLIEQRIKEQVTEFKEVAGSADLSNILQARVSDPGCYVFQERTVAKSNEMIGLTRQQVTIRFAVIIVVRNVKDSRGVDAADISALLQESVRIALLGWIPHDACDPIEYVDGNLVSFANGFFVWKDSYQTFQFIRSL